MLSYRNWHKKDSIYILGEWGGLVKCNAIPGIALNVTAAKAGHHALKIMQSVKGYRWLIHAEFPYRDN